MSKPRLYWWSPARIPRSLAVESLRNTRAWSYLLSHGVKRISNFGDAVNPLVFEALSSKSPRWSSARSADFALIGSVIETLARAGSDAIVVGAGLKSGFLPDDTKLQFRGVRGRLSAAALGLPASAAIGDPGLVIRDVVSVRHGGLNDEVLLLPHFSVANSRDGRRLISAARAHGATVVLPNEHPIVIAKRIASSRLVLTSSLHAMVFADSLGTPVQLVRFEGGREEPLFKYLDYESVFGVSSDVIPLSSWISGETCSSDLMVKLDHRTEEIRLRIDDVIEGIFAAWAFIR